MPPACKKLNGCLGLCSLGRGSLEELFTLRLSGPLLGEEVVAVCKNAETGSQGGQANCTVSQRPSDVDAGCVWHPWSLWRCGVLGACPLSVPSPALATWECCSCSQLQVATRVSPGALLRGLVCGSGALSLTPRPIRLPAVKLAFPQLWCPQHQHRQSWSHTSVLTTDPCAGFPRKPQV